VTLRDYLSRKKTQLDLLLRIARELEDHARRLNEMEKYMDATDEGLAAVEAETTRIADWIAANLPNDNVTREKFAPIIEHLKKLGAPDEPVPALPAGLRF
jgi:hypothetical protein